MRPEHKKRGRKQNSTAKTFIQIYLYRLGSHFSKEKPKPKLNTVHLQGWDKFYALSKPHQHVKVCQKQCTLNPTKNYSTDLEDTRRTVKPGGQLNPEKADTHYG